MDKSRYMLDVPLSQAVNLYTKYIKNELETHPCERIQFTVNHESKNYIKENGKWVGEKGGIHSVENVAHRLAGLFVTEGERNVIVFLINDGDKMNAHRISPKKTTRKTKSKKL